MKSIYTLQRTNRNKTFALILLFIGLVGLVFYAASIYFNNIYIAVMGLAISLVQTLVAYYSGDKVALAISGSKEVSYDQSPKLHNLIENLAKTAGIPKPRIYISPDSSANAFATGRNPEHASVSVNQGLLDILDKNELEAVLAHELSHIVNRDILVMTVTAVLSSVIAFIADMGYHFMFLGNNKDSDNKNPFAIIAVIAVIVLAPIISFIIQMAVSRSREYLADAGAVQLTRYPQGMISALEKLYKSPVPSEHYSTSTNHFFIAPPKKSFGEKMQSWFSTHPTLEDRIKALKDHS